MKHHPLKSPSMPNVMRAMAFFVVSGILASCAPYVGVCAWLEPTGDTAIRVTAARKVTAPQECDCVRCAAPGVFQLHRSRYVLEFWNGDRWYPQLLVRAVNDAGEKLTLRANQLSPLKSEKFDYILMPSASEQKQRWGFPERLNVTVKDAQGNTLGTESIELRMETRRHLAFDSL